jgi:site-specific recombinase XerC
VYPIPYANPAPSPIPGDIPPVLWSHCGSAISEAKAKYQVGVQPAVDSLVALVHALPLDRCPAAVYLAQLKQSSRRPQKQALGLIASLLSGGIADCLTLNWAAVRYQHTAAVRGRLLDGYAPATANRILSALRGVLEQTWLLDQMSAEDYHRAARLSPVIGETLPAGRELLAEEIATLLRNCTEDSRIIGIRYASIISIMFGAGLRREEVTKLNLDDYDHENKKLVIRGKRSKQRIAYLVDGAIAALSDWLEIRGRDPGPIFLAVKKGGGLIYGRQSTDAPGYLSHLSSPRKTSRSEILHIS